MSILSRFFTVIRANLNALLNRAEDPGKLLEQTLLDLDHAYRQAKEQVARAMADQKRLEKSTADHQSEIQRWEERAMLAVQKGDDELAREALKRKNEYLRLSAQFQQELEAHRGNVARLKTSLKELEEKIGEIRRKKNLLLSKQRRAEAQEKITLAIENLQGTGALETVARMEEKIEHMAALADSRQELKRETSGEDLERRFAALDGQSDIDAELLELKQRIRLPQTTK